MEAIPSKEEAPIEVSEAQPSDAEDIQNVYYKTWLATYPNEEAGITKDDVEDWYKDRFSEEALQRLRNGIEKYASRGGFIVARDTGKVIGICGVTTNETNNQLRSIYVLPEYQHKGVGKMLWDAAQKFLDHEKDTLVEVAEYNQQARDFYSKLGFEDAARRFTDEKFRFKSGAIIPEMEMILKSSLEK